MKLEIDIPSILYKDAKENRNYISLTKLEIVWKAIADGKPIVQEPMVEIDLYSVIKQKYIEREVLDKIKEQIKSHLRGVEITLEVLVENDPLRPKMEGAKDTLEECMEIIDKAESENT